ncbi:Smg-6, nonsense mediated mRNA decay factor [Homalodisca vitripennis]|nr:Smg-6, nonsense mediated mRNA decay factor [Homalodisca vitripennis]
MEFELMEKQKQEEREARNKEKMKEKECTSRRGVQLRQEVWIHPEGGRRVHRTTSTAQADYDDSEAELEALSHVILTKRFSMSFIHVHGKLFTKVGMESFQGAALQMLKEFRALLQHSPLPLNSTRLLQLLALNMFAIENTQLKRIMGSGWWIEVKTARGSGKAEVGALTSVRPWTTLEADDPRHININLAAFRPLTILSVAIA